jgi:hypothetical protein
MIAFNNQRNDAIYKPLNANFSAVSVFVIDGAEFGVIEIPGAKDSILSGSPTGFICVDEELMSLVKLYNAVKKG